MLERGAGVSYWCMIGPWWTTVEQTTSTTTTAATEPSDAVLISCQVRRSIYCMSPLMMISQTSRSIWKRLSDGERHLAMKVVVEARTATTLATNRKRDILTVSRALTIWVKDDWNNCCVRWKCYFCCCKYACSLSRRESSIGTVNSWLNTKHNENPVRMGLTSKLGES